MNRRITITLDKNLEVELRNIQAEKIQVGRRSVSFSEIINNILKEGLKNNHQ